MNKKILLIILFLLCFAIGIAIPRYVLTKTVTVSTPHKGQAIEAIYATGTVEPTIMIPIAPRTAGHLAEMAGNEGQTVRKGDILARLEDTEQQAAIAELTAKLTFASADFKRKQQLYKAQSVSRDILEAAKADLESLTAQLEKAKAQAGYLTLISPADGLIIKRDGEIGEMIGAAQPIFYISCCAPLRITAEVDEEDIPQVREGQDVLIQSDAFPDQVFQGKISSITPKGDPVARSYRVRMTFDNQASPLRIGMTAETNIITKKSENALLVPATAIGKENTVQTIRNNQVARSIVKTGIKDIDTIEILSGLSEDDIVMTTFNPDLEDGQKVRTIFSAEGTK